MTTIEDRFWAKVQKDDGCWLWTGARNPEGYGHLQEGYAHRLSYELQYGPIPAGLTIDHLCRVRHCVNPEHLEAVSLAENIRRGLSPTMAASRANECIKGHPLATMRTGRRYCRECGRRRTVEAYRAGRRTPTQLRQADAVAARRAAAA